MNEFMNQCVAQQTLMSKLVRHGYYWHQVNHDSELHQSKVLAEYALQWLSWSFGQKHCDLLIWASVPAALQMTILHV